MIVKTSHRLDCLDVRGQGRGAVQLFVHRASPEGQQFLRVPRMAAKCEAVVDQFPSIVVGEH